MERQISSEFASFASSPTARPAPAHLPALVDEVLAGYRIGLPANVRIEAALPEGLPQVQIDRALLGRAMINIIENALHAMPSGGTVTVHARQLDRSWVRISLTDTGVGMDATGSGVTGVTGTQQPGQPSGFDSPEETVTAGPHPASRASPIASEMESSRMGLPLARVT